MLRLFNSTNTNTNSGNQKEISKKVENEIIEALSIFLKERNEIRKSSLESKIYNSIRNLIKDKKFSGADNEDIDKDQNDNLIYQFTNEDIISKVKQVLNSHDIPLRPESFYSDEFGMLSIRKIISICKSKFNAKRIKTPGDNSKRGLEFSKEILEQSAKHYDVPDVIKICSDNEIKDIVRTNNNDSDKQNNISGASLASLATYSEDIPTTNTEHSSAKTNIDNKNNIEIPNNKNDSNNNNQEKVDNIITQNTDIYHKNVACVAYDARSELDKNNESTNDNDSILYNDRSESKNKVLKIIRLSPKKNSNVIIYEDQNNNNNNNNNNQYVDSDKDIHLPRIPCQYCDYSHFNDIDLSLHYLEEHRQELIKIDMRASLEYKADFVIMLTKKTDS